MIKESLYRNQTAWDKEMGKLFTELQRLGELLSPKQSRELKDRIYNVAQKFAEINKVPLNDRTSFLTQLKYIMSEIPKDKLFKAELIETLFAHQMPDFNITRWLVHTHTELGLAKIKLDHAYWLKLGEKRADSEVNSPLETVAENDSDQAKFIASSIDHKGYCESPDLLMSGKLSKRRFPERMGEMSSMWYYAAKNRFGETFLHYGGMPKKIFDFAEFAKKGREEFDKFVSETKLPVAFLGDVRALVYHPQKLRKIQSLKILLS